MFFSLTMHGKTSFYFTLFFLFLISSLYAQQRYPDSISIMAPSTPKLEKTWELYWKPLALFDPVTATVQAGFQKTITRRFAVAFDYGLQMPALSIYYKKSERQDYRYSKSMLELKYYLKKVRRMEAADGYHYVSLRGFYFPQTYTKTNDYVTLDDVSYHYDVSNIKRTVFSFDALFGYQLYSKRFSYNPYVGLGLRSITIQHHAQGLQPGFEADIPDFHFTSLDRQQGTFLRPDLVLGFRFGYRFGR